MNIQKNRPSDDKRPMRVIKKEGVEVTCSWYENGKYMEGVFHIEDLTKKDPRIPINN